MQGYLRQSQVKNHLSSPPRSGVIAEFTARLFRAFTPAGTTLFFSISLRGRANTQAARLAYRTVSDPKFTVEGALETGFTVVLNLCRSDLALGAI